MSVTFYPPRPICLEEPCLSWTGRVCGHSIIFGPGTCLYDDPERYDQRERRLQRKDMIGHISRRRAKPGQKMPVNLLQGFSLVPFTQHVNPLSCYDPSSFEYFFHFIKQDCDSKFGLFKSRMLTKFKYF